MRVPGEGPTPCRIAFVGEGPGKEEAKRGRPFIGKSGDILWQFAFRYANLRRDEVYVTNLAKERLTDAKGEDRPPTEDEFVAMAPELRLELERVAPRFILTLGRFSSRALLARDVEMETIHGMPFQTTRGEYVVPAFHPAAGIHNSNWLQYTSEDLRSFGEIIRGRGRTPVMDVLAGKAHYRRVDAKQLAKLLPDAFRGPLAIDTEGSKADPWCLTFSFEAGVAYLIEATDKAALAVFWEWLKRTKPLVIFHYAMADFAPLRKMGGKILEWGIPFRDTNEDAYLLQTEPRGLKALATRLCGMEMQDYEDLVGPVAERMARDWIEMVVSIEFPQLNKKRGRKHTLQRRLSGLLAPSRARKHKPKTIRDRWYEKKFGPIKLKIENVAGSLPTPNYAVVKKELGQKFVDYACKDADATGRCFLITAPRVVDEGLTKIARIDLEAMPLFERMSQKGMYVEPTMVDDLERYVTDEQAATLEMVRILTEVETFNPMSGDQVAAWLNSEGIYMSKQTKSRARDSTADELLQAVQTMHEAIPLILDYRKYDKLRSTYIPALRDFRSPKTGRIYPRWKLTTVVTGRASCEDPNLLAFPVRDKVGRRVRTCIRAPEGRRIGSCDQSQIELRTAAAVSQDANMMSAFKQGKDFHADVVQQMFGLPPEKQDPYLHRVPVKNGNFAVLYGATPPKLEEMYKAVGIKDWPEKRCKKFIDDWFELYPDVKRFLESKVTEALRFGYVTTPFGRKRYLPAVHLEGWNWPFRTLREEAHRQAGNVPIQGGAQEILKRVMPRIEKEVLPEMREYGYCEPILQIHDELLFEYDEDLEDMLAERVKWAMEFESPFRGVPLKASWASAESWGDIKK